MLKGHKKTFDGVFTKKDFKKPPKNTKRPAISPGVGTVGADSAISEDFEKVVDHFIACGMPEKARFLKMVFEKPNNFSKHLMAAVEGPEGNEDKKLEKLNELAPSDALALMLRLDLSHAQYQSIKNVSDYQKSHFLPSLHVIQEEKEECLPANIKVTEDEFSVPLDDMMEKTFERHMEDDSFRKNVDNVYKRNGEEIMEMEVYFKAGYDCASGQSQFKVSTLNFGKTSITLQS